MPTWPETLPQLPQQDGWSEKRPNTELRTNMDQGDAKSRRRFTAASRTFQMSLFMDGAQVEIFDQFIEDDLAGGVLPFTWVHPRTQASATVKIISSTIGYSSRGPNYMVSFDMEIKP